MPRWLVLFLVGCAGAPRPVSETATGEPDTASPGSSSAAPLDWWGTVLGRIGAESRAFRAQGDTFVATVRGSEATFGPDGLTLVSGSAGTLRIRTVAAGRPDHPTPLLASPVSSGACTDEIDASGACIPRVEADRGVVTEWWRTTSTGFEQGWDVTTPPAGAGPLVVDVDAGTVTSVTGTEALLLDSAGDAWRWTGLAAFDADGDAVPVRLTLSGEHLRVEVDDTGATYPVVIDPVLVPVSAGAELAGSGGEGLGAAVAGAGDVDGDGYDDVIVGAPGWGGGEGRAYVFHGSAGGLTTTATTTLSSPSATARFGAAVAGLGDTDGDGFPDVAVGGPDAAIVAVYAGGAGGVGATAMVTLSGSPGSGLGSALAGGDVDGDGSADLVAGAPDEGAVWVYTGGAGGISSSGDSVTGPSGFGTALAVGPLDVDGYDDVAIGSPAEGDGRVYLYRGSAAGLTTGDITVDGATAGAELGAAVAIAGDTDSDGRLDLLVGSPGAGEVALYAAGQITQPPLQTWSGSGRFGAAVASGGDANNDGYDDVLVGSPDVSRITMYHGSLSGPGPSPARTLDGVSGESLGAALAPVGDVNGDGFDDALAGAPDASSGDGRAYLLPGSAAGDRWTAGTALTGDAGDALGGGVAGAGDLDGDGYDDVLVGAPGYASSTGRAYLFPGAATGLSTTATQTWTGTNPGDLFGTGLAGVGDLDGDGRGDIAIGAPAGAGGFGSVSVFLNSAAGFSTTPSSSATGSLSGSYFGVQLAGAGDVNGDGRADLVVGAPYHNANRGRAFVFHGTTGGILASASTLIGGNSSEYAGCSVAGPGDLNGDGYDDVLVGGYGNSSSAGRARIFYGSASGVPSAANVTLNGSASSSFGAGVDGAGDVDGDGWPDIVVGAASDGLVGAAYIFRGGSAGVGTTAWASVSGDTFISLFGARVAGAGDINGDGHADIAVGAPYHTANAGYVYVYEGSSTGLTLVSSLAGETASYLGAALDGAGDVDGDGFDDLIAGAGQYDGDLGRAYVLYGYAVDDDADGVVAADDCDDHDAATFAGAAEVCDGVDNDCDGAIDEGATDASDWYADADGDNAGDPAVTTAACDQPAGYVANASDCDDTDPATHPGADERCDGEDDDCDGTIDELAVDASLWHADADGDTYGDPAAVARACAAPTGFVADASDCDDTDPAVNPAATEVCNGVDDDCDGTIDAGAADAVTWYADADADSYGDPAVSTDACAAPAGYVADATDCDDANAFVNPGADEVCDGIDDDCDGAVDEGAIDAPTWYDDADGDTFGDPSAATAACSAPAGTVPDATDCDDTDASVHPGADELCDGVDDDCDGSVDELALDASTWHSDADGDAYGDPTSTARACTAPAGFVADGTDCADADASIHPGAPETCDGVDEDCDGVVDDGATDATTWYADVDADRYGNPAVSTAACAAPAGYVADATDCDDAATFVNPAATEVCDGIDNNCDSLVDVGATDARTWHPDADGDTYGDPSASTDACTAPAGHVADATDCNDGDSGVHPGAAETCDGVDEDCDGAIDEGATDATAWYTDADGDTYGDPAASTTACSAPAGTVADATDCDDAIATVYPGAPETCDGLDDDCDGAIDEGAGDASTWYADADGDGFGDPDTAASACAAPPGYVADATDCDDTDPAAFPGATEVCNGVDDDCDGTVDVGAVDPSTWYADTDGDLFGDPAASVEACDQPADYVPDNTDCDDADSAYHPGAPESCNDPNDYNCDGSVTYADVDADGVPACEDCDDTDATSLPGGVEVCDGRDNDCDGTPDDGLDTSTWYPDEDGDSYGDEATPIVDCAQPAGTLEDGTDCDDTDPAVNPGAEEVCDGVDNNCDGATDAKYFETTAYSICDDTDGDGLVDYDEVARYGTSPDRADTDGGGVDDGTEVLVDGTDPLDPSDDLTGEKVGGCGCGTGAGESGAGILLGLGVLVMRRRR